MTVQQQREQKHQKTLKLVETAMLAAIVVLMSFTPIGYLKVGALSITFIMIPVVIGGRSDRRLARCSALYGARQASGSASGWTRSERRLCR